jgi:hypothetical protein
LGIAAAFLADAGQVALDVGQEHRHADGAEALGHHLQRDGLAGAGGARDQAVAVGHFRQEMNPFPALGDRQRFGHVDVEYDFEPPGRQKRQGWETLKFVFPGDPGVLAVDFILK